MSSTQDLILAVDDNEDALYALEQILIRNGFRVNTAGTGPDAIARAVQEPPAVILLDVVMPQLDGYQVTARLKADPNLRFVPLILLTAKDSLADIIKGLDRGADGYITKPFKPEELIARLRAALRLRAVYEELRTTQERNEGLIEQISSPYNFQNIIGTSSKMKQVLTLLTKVVNVDSPVLITGPSGTGKELIARAIHFNSLRRGGPFVPINCAALNENLLESELFGHVKGSFTGAMKDRVGLFEAADGGTLFLDEIGEMSPSLQAKLLRVLQEARFMPVGGTAEKEVDVRIVAATNRNLGEMAERGEFREDLYYRLNVITVTLPPLQDRREDIPVLIDHFLAVAQKNVKGQKKRLSQQALEVLSAYRWRGNVRELQNEIERLLILGQDSDELGTELISTRIVDEFFSGAKALNGGIQLARGLNLKAAIEELERRMIRDALERTGGNKSVAAKELGISRSNLITKVQQHHLERAK